MREADAREVFVSPPGQLFPAFTSMSFRFAPPFADSQVPIRAWRVRMEKATFESLAGNLPSKHVSPQKVPLLRKPHGFLGQCPFFQRN